MEKVIKDLVPEKVDTIIIHCTDTSASDSIGVADVTRWHKNRGYSTIGYHYLIRPDGEILVGRDITKQGAHAYGENNRSIGIAYVGGRDASGHVADTRTFAQKVSIVYLIGLVIKKYYPNINRIVGHNDVSVKTCPNFDAKFEYRDLVEKFNVCFPSSRVLEGKTLINSNINL